MRPQLNIQKEPVDKALELAGVIGVIVMIALPLYYWPDIPDIVPTHFNAAGQPDDFGSKWSMVVLPIIGALLVLGLYWINKYPHKFNYPQKVTEANAHNQYRMASRLIRVVGTMVALSFAYLTYTVIHTSLGTLNGPGKYFVIFCTVSLLIVPVIYLILSRQAT